MAVQQARHTRAPLIADVAMNAQQALPHSPLNDRTCGENVGELPLQ